MTQHFDIKLAIFKMLFLVVFYLCLWDKVYRSTQSLINFLVEYCKELHVYMAVIQ